MSKGQGPQRPKPKLTHVILERELELRVKGRRKAKVIVRFGKPRPFEGRDFACVYQIDGLRDEPITRRMYGIDAIQALELAMQMAMVELVCSEAYQDGRLTWLGMYDLGLPVMGPIRDKIKPDPKAERAAKQVDAELEAARRRARRRAASGKKRP
jgi:hypothetical protein